MIDTKLETVLLKELRELPQEKQKEVLKFTQLLRHNFGQSLTPASLNIEIEKKVENWLKVINELPKSQVDLPEEALHRDTMYY